MAKQIGLQARGVSGEHSKIDEEGKSDISPLIRFGATESLLTKILFEGLRYLYKMEDKIKPKLWCYDNNYYWYIFMNQQQQVLSFRTLFMYLFLSTWEY